MADDPTLYGTVKFRFDTQRGYWGYLRPDGPGADIFFCSDAVDGEAVKRTDRVAYIKHRLPSKPPKKGWSAYKVWRV